MLRSILGIVRNCRPAVAAALAKIPYADFSSFLAAYRHSPDGSSGSSTIHLRQYGDPFVIRHGTSDFEAFCQVLLLEEYRMVPDLSHVRTVVDAGANVGFSARYLCQRFPDSRVIAIEPDRANFDAAQSNLSALGSRCDLVHGALWSRSGQVDVVRGAFRDGRDWSVQVQESSGMPTTGVRCFSLPALMDQFDI